MDTLNRRLYYFFWFARRLIMLALAFGIKNRTLGALQIQGMLLMNLGWAWYMREQ